MKNTINYYVTISILIMAAILVAITLILTRPSIAPIDYEKYTSTGVETLFPSSGNNNNTPTDPIGFVYYQKENGKEGTDFFVIYTKKQDELNGRTIDENNKIMWDYLHNNMYSVNVGNMKEGYIMFTTEKPIANNRDLFLGLDGSGKGAINRNYAKKGNYDNEYLFDINELYAGGYKIDFQSYIRDGKIIIGGYIGEKSNTIRQITIVVKN